MNEQASYAPPPGPPPGIPKLVDFPFLSSEQFQILYSQGFARVSLPPDHALLKAATALFSTSRAFFNQTSEEKQQFHRSNLLPDSSADGSNSRKQSYGHGWFRVEGEKEMLTVRCTRQLCPPEVTEDARNLWQECGNFMQAMVHAIEASLGLDSGAFDNVVREECLLPANEIHETLLRMFRYERASDPRIVSEKHRDIGILSLVIGSSPGLEVWDSTITRKDPLTGIAREGSWVPIEEDGNKVGGPTLTFLVGETLTTLSNDLYKPGIHRVSVPPADPSCSTGDAKYRYSIVFALRPHRQGVIHTPSLTTAITGPFKWPRMDENGVIPTVKAVDLFNEIANRRWSVNDSVERREAAKTIRFEKERAMMQN
jgi:isopenicillin N synthase-like dioxygenase